MSYIYNQIYKVPVWILVAPDADHQEEIKQFCTDAEALVQPWPAHSFIETVNELKNQGWGHVLDRNKPYRISADFLGIAAAKHVKKVMGNDKTLGGSQTKPWHHVIDMTIKEDKDFERILNTVLHLERDMYLSHLFSIAERCHRDRGRNYRVFASFGAIPPDIIQRLAYDTVIIAKDGGDVATEEKEVDKVIEDVKEVTMSKLDSLKENSKLKV